MPYSLDGRTIYYYGEPKLEAITDLKSRYSEGQVYGDILSQSAGSVFVDPEFPHNEDSIGDQSTLFDTADPELAKEVQGWRDDGWSGRGTWIRVADLCKTLYGNTNVACFNCGDVGKTIARNDIQQGTTGDCWFLCAVSSVSMVPELISVVVPSDNTTNDTGVYHFRIWYEGAWVDIVVDDYVPCIVTNDQTFTVGTNFYPNKGQAEFWPLLLEKAFAKLNGSYSNIAGNVVMYALESLTGGFGEIQEFSEGLPKDLYSGIRKWFDRGCVLGAGSKLEKKGIFSDHAYSVTGAQIVTTFDGTEHKLLRLRNPWGNSEWQGEWSDKSSAWDEVSHSQKDAIGLVVKDDGEFWMSYHDFLKYFDDVSGCFYLDPKLYNRPGSKYQLAQFSSAWSTANGTTGGFDSPWQNPHYVVDVESNNEKGTLVVGTLVLEKLNNNWNEGFCIRLFPVDQNDKSFGESFFENHYNDEIYPFGQTECPGSGTKSFSVYYQLKAGKYLIVPSSLQPGLEERIVVRVYNEGSSAAQPAPASAAGRSGSQSGSQAEESGSSSESE